MRCGQGTDVADLAEDCIGGWPQTLGPIAFDYGFLQSEFPASRLKYAPEVLCTVRLSRRLYPRRATAQPGQLIERHGPDLR